MRCCEKTATVAANAIRGRRTVGTRRITRADRLHDPDERLLFTLRWFLRSQLRRDDRADDRRHRGNSSRSRRAIFGRSRNWSKRNFASARISPPARRASILAAALEVGRMWRCTRRARVVAIDRSPLRPDLMANPALTFLRGDAFKYQPPETVDWLLCDVIAFPQRIIDLLQTWIAGRWCRRFCVTIKFRGNAEYPLWSR